MDDTNRLEFSLNYQEALDRLPQEVRDFLWSDLYTKLIQGIAKQCNLTETQQEVVSLVLTDLVITTTDEIGARKRLTEAGISEQNQNTIFSLGYDYIISLADAITKESIVNPDIEADLEAERAAEVVQEQVPVVPEVILPNTSTTTSPEALAAIQQKLMKPTTASPAPTTRDYSLDKTPVTIDPYKEPIDNK